MFSIFYLFLEYKSSKVKFQSAKSGNTYLVRQCSNSIEAANLFYDRSGRNDGQARYEAGLAETAAARVAAEKQAAQQEQANIFLQNSLAEQKAREAAQKVKADKAAQDRQDAARRQNNKYETGPVPKNIFTSGTGGSSSGRGSRAGKTAPAAPKATPKKETTTRRYTGRYGL